MAIVNAFNNVKAKIEGIGKNIVMGVWEGIKSMGKWIGDKVGGFFDGMVGGITRLLGINSPSKVFAGIGENMALGLGEGFDSEMDSIGKNIGNAIPTDFEFNGNLNNRKIEHGGVIRIEGVNTRNELLGVVDIIMDNLRMEARLA
jgi:hypothetical protein